MATGTLTNTTIAARYLSLLKLTGTGNDVLAADASAKYIEDGNGNDSVLSLSTTRVGIGNTAPTALLTAGAITTLLTDGTTAVTPEGVNVHITEASKYAMGIKNADASGDGLIIQAGDASDDFALRVEDYDSANDLFVVQGGGNVGIGTATPQTTFHINESGEDAAALTLSTYDTTITNTTGIGRIEFAGTENNSAWDIGARIAVEASEAWSVGSAAGANMYFQLNTTGATTLATKMSILNSGNVGIGTSDPNKSSYGTNAKVLTVADYGSAGDYGAIEIAGYRTNDGLVGDLTFPHLDSSGDLLARATVRGLRDGANDAVALQFHTEATGASMSAKMTILSAGNVGIGTASPTVKLDVDGGFHLWRDDLTSPHADMGFSFIIDGSGGDQGDLVISATHTKNTTVVEHFRIQEDTGNVGIGTSAPWSNLEVEKNVSGLVSIQVHNTAGSSDGDAKVGYLLALDDTVIADGGNWYMGIDSATAGEPFQIGEGNAPGTTARLTIKSGGHIGIGIAAPLSPLHIYSSGETNVPILHVEHGEGDMETGDEILRLHASSDADIHTTQLKIITIHDAGGEIGKFVTASDGNINTAWTNVSDVRLKKDIQDTSMDGLSIMNSLKLRDFKWNAELGKYRENKQVIGGLIADEVYEVYRQATTGTPGAVKEDGSIDRMGVTESQFITVMMKAIQELSAKVEALENT